jgi:hypothetical protein
MLEKDGGGVGYSGREETPPTVKVFSLCGGEPIMITGAVKTGGAKVLVL